MRKFIALGAAVLLSGCGGLQTPTVSGAAAYELFDQSNSTETTEYRIGPFDKLSIFIVGETAQTRSLPPEISVGPTGEISFPFIKSVNIGGLTSAEAALLIEQRLVSEGFYVDPEISVFPVSIASRKITVEGDVILPGVFELDGPTSLIQAMALAQGPTRTARLNEVIIFRKIEGDTYAAQFDLEKVRLGIEPDLMLQGEDVIVVSRSSLKQAYQDFLRVAPTLATAFIQLTRNN